MGRSVMVPRESDDGSAEALAIAWGERISENWRDRLDRAFAGLTRLGTTSNGVTVYKHKYKSKD